MSCEQSVTDALAALTNVEPLIAAVKAATDAENDTAGGQMADDALQLIKQVEKILGDITTDCQAADAAMAAEMAAATAAAAATQAKVIAGKAAPNPQTPVPGRDVFVADIPSITPNFDPNAWVAPSPIPGTMGSDVVGAFRLTFSATHGSYDDPIVHPGQPGANEHHHTFWGNPATDASFYDYVTLMTTGINSGEGGPINRSAKWMPSLMTGNGEVVVPEFITEYYKQIPAVDGSYMLAASAAEQARINAHRAWIRDANGVYTGEWAKTVALPDGLEYIVGNTLPADFFKGTLGHIVNWNLYALVLNASGQPQLGALIGQSTSLADVLALMTQGTSYYLQMSLGTPHGWDGKRVAAADHYSHLCAPKWDGNKGRMWLPDTHPFVMPAIEVKPLWRITPAVGDPKQMHLSSDMMTPGDMAHFDYKEGWFQPIKQEWQDHAINGFLNCSSANLGSGRQLKRSPAFAAEPFGVKNNVQTLDADGRFRMIGADGTRLVF